MFSRYNMLVDVKQEQTSRVGEENNYIKEPVYRRLSVPALSLLPADERHTMAQVLSEWECGAEYPVQDARIDQLVSATARTRRNAIAVRCAGRTLTYEQLDARASALAQVLVRDGGVTPRSFVGVFMARSEQLVVALLAVLKCGELRASGVTSSWILHKGCERRASIGLIQH